MNWIKLGPKEPRFNERVLFMNAKDEWWEGYLEEIKQTLSGKVYFVSVGNEGNQSTNVTHFMRIITPKEKE